MQPVVPADIPIVTIAGQALHGQSPDSQVALAVPELELVVVVDVRP